MTLLDWEKAFDKVDREGMFIALERMNVDVKIINIIKQLYKRTEFKVELDGVQSEWEEQSTGIRQGCPLSPYLCLVVMTVMFHDIKERVQINHIQHRVPGTEFDEILYADDTICLSTDTRQMNIMIKEIEIESKLYGMKLNKKKCEVIYTSENANVHFMDGTKLTRKDEVKYLGCDINEKASTDREIRARLANTMTVLKKLDLFWLHSDCPTRIKIIALDAIIRAKLLYGLESAQLGEGALKKLDVFHLKQ